MPSRKLFIVLILLSLIANLTVSVFLWIHQPSYLTDYRQSPSSDAQQYVQMGRNIWERGAYSRQYVPPYAPDDHRTPVYPVLAGAVQQATGMVWPLFGLQAFLHLLTAILVFGCGRRVVSDFAGGVAATLFLIDPLGVMLNWYALSETTYVFLSMLTIYLAVRAWQRERDRALDYVAVGAVAGLAALTRPTALYLAVGLAVFTLGRWVYRRREFRLMLTSATVLLITTFVCVSPWIVRNYAVFGIPRLTTIDSVALAYLVAPSVYELKYGIDHDSAIDRISREFSLPPRAHAYNQWLSTEDPATSDRRRRTAGLEVIKREPVLFLKASAIGLSKTMLGHHVPELAGAARLSWEAPGFGALAAGRFSEFGRRLGANHPFLVAVFLLQVIVAIAVIVGACVGAVLVLVRSDLSMDKRYVVLVIVAVLLYHAASVSVLGVYGEARYRAALVPLACILTALATETATRYIARLQARRTAPRAYSGQ